MTIGMPEGLSRENSINGITARLYHFRLHLSEVKKKEEITTSGGAKAPPEPMEEEMEKEKRMLGDYEVLQSVWIGDHEVVVAENKNAPASERYICAYVENNGFTERGVECMASDSYPDILSVYGDRISEKAEETQKMIEDEQKIVGNDDPLTKRDCIPIKEDSNLNGQIIVIRSDVLRPEFQRSPRQLYVCTGGFGASTKSRGRTCYCTRLFDGVQTSFYRQDVLGTIPQEQLPAWAKDGYEKHKERHPETEKEVREAR